MSKVKVTIGLQTLGLLIVYIFTAKWGLTIGAVSIFATLVWPPTGISLAAMFFFGYGVWPAIFFGAAFVNWTAGAPIAVALGMAIGNTLEALIGTYLLRRAGFRRSLSRVRDVFSLVILAGFASTMVSASIGVASLFWSGMITREAILPTGLAWWLGDMLGDLLVAPFLFVWSQGPYLKELAISRIFEVLLLLGIVFAGCLLVFGNEPSKTLSLFQQPYLIFPLLILVAVRLNQRWTVASVVMIAITVIWITTHQHGIFWNQNLSESLLRAQIFVAILAISKIVLAATVMERKEREHEANEALQTRDDFLSIASHELKTPLTSLYLQLQLFNRELDNASKQASDGDTVSIQKRSIRSPRVSEQQAKKLKSLLDELLDLTRIRAGQLKLEKENVDLRELVEDVVKGFRVEMNPTNAVPIQVLCLNPTVGKWDRIRIEQVVTNLVSNALKYGNAKPISISIDTSHSKAKLVVKDHGVGISEEMKDKIFERFHRGGIQGHPIPGLGLGLYICRQIIHAHHGEIAVESQLGKGTSFSVQIPVSI